MDENAWKAVDELDVRPNGATTFFDEVQEVICLPQRAIQGGPHSKDLDPEVEVQLLDFLDGVAGAYNENPFHSHAHATRTYISC